MAVAAALRQRCPGPVRVALGMRYGNPSITSALAELRDAGARRLLVLPLYPQYSAATVASTFDAVAAELVALALAAGLAVDHPLSRRSRLSGRAGRQHPHRPRRTIRRTIAVLFHGLPKRNLLAGDPTTASAKTARLVAERLGLVKDQWAVAFQSRFGRAEWLQPTPASCWPLGEGGIKRVDVICPGFAADCLETLEEIARRNRAVFLAAGGEHYRYIRRPERCSSPHRHADPTDRPARPAGRNSIPTNWSPPPPNGSPGRPVPWPWARRFNPSRQRSATVAIPDAPSRGRFMGPAFRRFRPPLDRTPSILTR